jgi:hypothetical protein
MLAAAQLSQAMLVLVMLGVVSAEVPWLPNRSELASLETKPLGG